jgi:putative endonuclease
MFYTYIIESISSGIYYKGSTSDYERRLEEHNCGHNFYTKNRGPWRLVFVQEFQTREEAIKLERRLKRCNKQYLKWLIQQPANILKYSLDR